MPTGRFGGFFQLLAAITAGFLLLSQGVEGWSRQKLSLPLLLLSLAAFCCVMAACVWYFRRQDKTMEAAVAVMEAVLSGDRDARIDCDEEGELYRLFHGVNTLSAVLNAHAANELKEKNFLKQTISGISHQLKTPLAALQVYNGLLQGRRRHCQPSGNLSPFPNRSWTVWTPWSKTC